MSNDQCSMINVQFPTDARSAMYPVIPAELMQSAVQLVVNFITLFGIALGVLLGARA